MEIRNNNSLLDKFEFDGVPLPVEFVETTEVTDGVKCDVYKFTGDNTKDLGVIKIEPGKKTPLQKVLKGDRTIEGFISGKGKLKIGKADGTSETFGVDEEWQKPFSISVEIGDTMQWESAPDSKLVAYEICFPPYEDGRYENLP